MRSFRESIEADATWLDRLMCRVFGCRELAHGGWQFGWCLRCGKRTRPAEAGKGVR